MENQDIRWEQRFQNFEKSMNYLEKSMQIKSPDMIQQAGMIHFFEMAFELAWNTIKDYLQAQGYNDIKSPRSALKKAFEIDLIEDGNSWLELLTNRNLTAHTYDEEKANEVIILLRQEYFPLLKVLYNTLKLKQNE